MTALVVALALPVGVLIGAVGIGGVLLPPALLHLGGLDVHAAAATSIWSFLFTGLVGSWAYARRGRVPWRFTWLLTAGIVPGAVAGALVNGVLSATVLTVLLAVLTLSTGGYHLIARTAPARRTELAAPAAVAVGVLVGFGSALTGTGGPILLVPVLLLLGLPALPAVAASMVIQLPLTVAATAGFLAHDAVRFGLGTLLGIVAAAGVLLGARIAGRLPENTLRTVVAGALLLVGLLLLVEGVR